MVQVGATERNGERKRNFVDSDKYLLFSLLVFTLLYLLFS